MIALVGFMLVSAAPAEAARGSKKAKSAEQTPQKAREKKTRKGADTSLRGRFAKIPTPRVPGASKIRLEWRHRAQGGGKLFRANKLKAKGPTGPTFKAKVLATTRKSLKRQ